MRFYEVLVVLVLMIVPIKKASNCRDDRRCPINEQKVECAPDYCDGEYCPETDLDMVFEDCPPADPGDCSLRRCMCLDGMLRNATGHCIPARMCPPIECTKPNEYLAQSPPTCPGETCDQAIVNPARCNALGSRKVTPREPYAKCRCIEGYYRNEEGECVEYSECPPMDCPPDEHLDDCPPQFCAGQYCQASPSSPRSCPPTKKCGIPKCMCNFNMRRNRLGICVPITKCPAFKCDGPNEEYQACRPVCPGENCTDYLNNATCPRFRIGIVVECRPGCFCKKGFYRNEQNICVEASKCKRPGCKGDPNAQEGCGVPCNRTCTLYNKPPVACSHICKPNSCDCKSGYVLNEVTGKCVLPENCPKECNKPNEEYSPAFDPCPPQTCRALIDGIACTQEVRPLQSGCRCKKDYYRNYLGECISYEDCYKCRGPHEYFSCGVACDNVCKTLATQNQTSCPVINITCNKKCYCEKRYARNNNNICVPIDQCEPVPKCTKPNEEFVDNPPACPGESCDDANMNPARCALKPKIYVPPKSECRCKNGYFRDKNLDCVEYKQCPAKDCPSGEYLDNCPPQFCAGQYCKASSSSPRSCPPNKECGIPKCMCSFNTRRNRLGICVPISQCPAFKCDGPNERYEACPPVCPGQNCTDYLNNATCPRYRIGIVVECHPTCRCNDGFYRNEQNVCVEASQCRTKEEGCGGDPNAQKGCGNPCGNTCKLYNNKDPVFCKELCKLNGCDCKKGYVLNEETGKCILPEQCPKKCNQPNEEYSSAFDPCPPQTCRALIDGVACTQEVRPPQSGCRCKKDYYRNYLGQCISSKDCLMCPGKREFFSCGSACDNVCETLSKRNQTHCDIINIVCNRMCYCEEGHARNNYNVCVPIDQCQKVRCPGEHESLGCGTPCDNVCATLSVQNQTSCPIKNKKCTEMCYCDDGRARNKKNQCVLFGDCDGFPSI